MLELGVACANRLRRFALMELAAKHRKYMNGKTGTKIGGKAYARMTNERLGLMQDPSMQMSAEQSLANNQVMSKWRDTKEHIKDRVIVGQRWLKLSDTFGPTVLLLIPTHWLNQFGGLVVKDAT